jgi:hypothetical protein
MDLKRFTLLILLLSILSACADYRHGSHWDANERNGWQRSDKVVRLLGKDIMPAETEWDSHQCNAKPFLLSTRKSGDSMMHSLFLIPLFLGHEAERLSTIQFVAQYPGIGSRCQEDVRNLFSIKKDSLVSTDYRVSACKLADCCVIDIPINPDTVKQIEIDINGSALSCRIAPLILERKSHFCMRGTEFGGSDSCKY